MNLISLLAILSTCLVHVFGLFEDQAGRFDWKQKYVGEATNIGYYSTSKMSVLVVATKSHVVAGLDADNGVIRWRHVFERDDTGHIWDLHVSQVSKHSASVSGHDQLWVRVWDSMSGVLVVEHLVRPDRVPDLVSIYSNNLVTVFYDGSEMEVVTYSYDNKKISESGRIVTKTPVQVGNVGGAVCQATDNDVMMLVCANDKGLHTLDISKGKSASWSSHALTGVKSESLTVTEALADVELAGGVRATLDVVQGKIDKQEAGVTNRVSITGCKTGVLSQECESEGRAADGSSYCDQFSQKINSEFFVHHLSEYRGRVVSARSVCEDGDMIQVVLVMEDAAMISLTQTGSHMFTREEGLASLELVQMVGMGTDNSRDEFDIHRIAYPGNFLDPQVLVQNFVSRIKRHVSQLQSFMLSITDLRLRDKTQVTTGDKFGLRKVVVGVTGQGKMYGLESRKGTILWQRMVSGPGKSLLIQRDGRSDINDAQAMLVYRHHRSTFFTLVFNPITGKILSDEPCQLELDQALLLPETHADLPRPVLLVGRDNSAAVIPALATNTLLEEMPRLFVMTERSGVLTGNMVTVKESSVRLVPMWTMNTAGDNIVAVRSRHGDEVVHSAGRVLADRYVVTIS